MGEARARVAFFFLFFFACLRACLGRTYDTPVAIDGMASSDFFFFLKGCAGEGERRHAAGKQLLASVRRGLTQIAVREIE